MELYDSGNGLVGVVDSYLEVGSILIWIFELVGHDVGLPKEGIELSLIDQVFLEHTLHVADLLPNNFQ